MKSKKSWGNLWEIYGKSWGNLGEIWGKSWVNPGEILGEYAVDNYIIWRMSGTTSGAYCQQWIAIRSAICMCDAVFLLFIVYRLSLALQSSVH